MYPVVSSIRHTNTVINESAVPVQPTTTRPRLEHLDWLRGAVIILMALDHTRDFFSHDVMGFEPTDLTKTSVAIFLSRWVTHFCAPVFAFLAGTSAYLSLGRGKSRGELAKFLITRGLWLVFLDLVWMKFVWTFNFNLTSWDAATLWALGWSMVALAGFIFLPVRVTAAIAVAMIAMHNLSDGVRPEAFGPFAWLWQVLHVQSPIALGGGYSLFVVYPLIPWLGIMAAGYAFGAIVKWERDARRRTIFCLGLGATLTFIFLRAANVYGDLHPWSHQRSAVFTALSFVNCQKYPPSLLFLLMTLGPALMLMAALDRGKLGRLAQPIITFGRVPMFFYLVHFPLIHLLAIIYSLAKYQTAPWLFTAPLAWDAKAYPADFGFGITGVWCVWLLVVLLMYPLCVWFAQLKQRRRDAWLSYF